MASRRHAMKHAGLIIVLVIGAAATIVQPELLPFALAAVGAYEALR